LYTVVSHVRVASFKGLQTETVDEEWIWWYIYIYLWTSAVLLLGVMRAYRNKYIL
jgi:hypothetical protein